MKFGQLKQYKMRNIFVEKSQTVAETLVPDLFLEN